MAGAFVLGALEPAEDDGRPRPSRDLPRTRMPRSPSSGSVLPVARRIGAGRRAAGRAEGPDPGRRRGRPGAAGGRADRGVRGRAPASAAARLGATVAAEAAAPTGVPDAAARARPPARHLAGDLGPAHRGGPGHRRARRLEPPARRTSSTPPSSTSSDVADRPRARQPARVADRRARDRRRARAERASPRSRPAGIAMAVHDLEPTTGGPGLRGLGDRGGRGPGGARRLHRRAATARRFQAVRRAGRPRGSCWR